MVFKEEGVMKRREKDVDEQNTLSRRDFIKGIAMGVGAAGVASTGLLTGCESTPGAVRGSGPGGGASTFGGGAKDYEVINTDLIIVGAGFGAQSAAFEALAKGKSVTIIEKTPFRHGGGAGYNWDAIATWVPEEQYDKQEPYLKRVTNHDLYYQANQSNPNRNAPLMLVNRGHSLPDRNADGSYRLYTDLPFVRSVEGVFPRLDLDELAKSPLVHIVDYTMVTDILVNKGRCLGVVGLYLPTGDIRVYRANATIVATGPATWFYGWTGVSAYSIGTPDNTGDVDMAAYRHGAGIGDSEYAAYDFATTYPKGLGFGWNTMMNPDANEYGAFADRNGKQIITAANGIDLQRILMDRVYFNTELAKLMLAGATTDDGGLLANLDNVHIRTAMRHSMTLLAKFGVDPFTDQLPIHDEIYERGGTPVSKDTMMAEDIEGIFFVRGAGISGTSGGSMLSLNYRFGSYALRCALEYIEKAPAVTTVDWTPAEKEFARLHELRTRKVSGGLRPHVIRHNIQKTCSTCMGILRETAKLEAANKELERIRREDLPKMVVSEQTLTYNNEWKEAVENYNLLDAAELAVKATLLRQESRGTYLRPDFPNTDDANWKCMLVAKQDKGTPVFAKKTMPERAW
jgi:succinate dehydrogenase / fumarate reductase flavoprotein subunit